MEAAGAPRRWPRRRSAQCIIDQRAIGISAAPDQQADDDDSGFDAWRCRRQLARSDDYAVGSDINCGGGAFGQRLTPWRAAIPPANWCAPTLAAIAAALPPEQLCWLSRGDCMKTLVPGLTGARHRVEDAKQLVRAGGERDLLRFARRKQAVVEGLDHRIEAHR